MSERPLSPIRLPAGPGPIERIARAQALAPGAMPDLAPAGLAEDGPDLQPVPQPLAPRGLAGAVDRALGRIELPTLLALADSLGAARAAVAVGPQVDPGLGDVIEAVLADEERKVMRYLDLRGR